MQNFLCELYFREDISHSLILKSFRNIKPPTFHDTLISCMRKWKSRISEKEECHGMMPVLWFSLFRIFWNYVRVYMEEEWVSIFIENEIHSHSCFLEYLTTSRVCWMSLSFVYMPTWIEPFFQCFVVYEEDFFIFWIDDTPICDDVTSEIFARSDILFPTL